MRVPLPGPLHRLGKALARPRQTSGSSLQTWAAIPVSDAHGIRLARSSFAVPVELRPKSAYFTGFQRWQGACMWGHPFQEEHSMRTRTLSSFEAFHRLVPSIVKRINEDTALAMRAMTNPILAMEELGIELEPALAREVERRLRFGEERGKKLTGNRSQAPRDGGLPFRCRFGASNRKAALHHARARAARGSALARAPAREGPRGPPALPEARGDHAGQTQG